MSDFIVKPIARVEVGGSPFGHRFGGANPYAGMRPSPGSPALHLLYDLDARDPLVPVRVPGMNRLPLCFGFAYNASEVAYRLKRNSEVDLLYVEDQSDPNGYPYEPFPAFFPPTEVCLRPISYEQHKLLVYYALFAQDSTDDWLSTSDAAWLEESRYPFTQLGGMHRMCQGVPEVVCRNPDCDSYQVSSDLKVFAVVWNNPIPGVALWDPDIEDGGDSQIIYQVCQECHTIHACNRCT